MKRFNFETRSENLKAFNEQEFDLCIIGGGITGAGAARDAASRGMKVALIEQNDFASGTSSRSSKLIHGGIRYLENLEFGLVYEALSERSILFDIAPHLVHPLRFLLPIYKHSRVGRFKMGLGMWLYDVLSLFEAPKMHENLNAVETLERIPQLQGEALTGSFVYSDAYMDDDRLVFETLRSANDLGAKCANYTKAISAEFNNGKVCAIHAKDLINNQDIRISAKHFLSTVGPWTDELGHQLLDQWKDIMRPSKGIHLTLSRERLPLSCAVVMAVDKEKRIIFGIPRHEMVIIGTTDTDYKDSPEKVHTEAEDAEYLLKIVSEYFPHANLTKEDIIASYAGVRPLVSDGSDTESGTSREHLIFTDKRNITFVAGGKYTTYRKMAEQSVDACLSQLSNEEQVRFAKPNTKVALNPQVTVDKWQMARRSVHAWAELYKVSQELVEFLVDRHGLEARQLLNYGEKINNEKNRKWIIEAEHAIENTMCFNLADFFLRRVPLFLAEPDNGRTAIDDLANHFAEKLSWSDKERKDQIENLEEHFRVELGWKQKL